jgi:hypothetical protein
VGPERKAAVPMVPQNSFEFLSTVSKLRELFYRRDFNPIKRLHDPGPHH